MLKPDPSRRLILGAAVATAAASLISGRASAVAPAMPALKS
jgi:hypothetical protein